MMLKKSLIAISLASAVGIANAGTLQPKGEAGLQAKTAISTAPQLVSKQSGLTNISGVSFDMLVSSTLAVRETYKNATGVKVTLTGATLTPASVPTLAGVYGNVSGTANITYTGNTALTFAVTPGALATPGTAATLTIGGLALATDGSTPVTAVVEVLSPIAGSPIDTASGTLLAFVNEFAIASTLATTNPLVPFNAVVDFTPTKFKSGGDTTLSDSATVSYTTAYIDHPISGSTRGVATKGAVKATATLKGDFSFLDKNGDGKIASTEGSVTGTVAKDLQSTSELMSGGVKAFTVATKGQTIPVQSYTADVAIAYTNSAGQAGKVTLTTAMGSWVAAGATSKLQFMPFGPQYANSITVTNTSKIAGDIKVSMIGNGKTVASTVVGTAAAQSVTQVGPAVAALAAANGIKEAYITVTTNAPVTDDVSVVGVYYSKADGDRVLTK